MSSWSPRPSPGNKTLRCFFWKSFWCRCHWSACHLVTRSTPFNQTPVEFLHKRSEPCRNNTSGGSYQIASVHPEHPVWYPRLWHLIKQTTLELECCHSGKSQQLVELKFLFHHGYLLMQFKISVRFVARLVSFSWAPLLIQTWNKTNFTYNHQLDVTNDWNLYLPILLCCLNLFVQGWKTFMNMIQEITSVQLLPCVCVCACAHVCVCVRARAHVGTCITIFFFLPALDGCWRFLSRRQRNDGQQAQPTALSSLFSHVTSPANSSSLLSHVTSPVNSGLFFGHVTSADNGRDHVSVNEVECPANGSSLFSHVISLTSRNLSFGGDLTSPTNNSLSPQKLTADMREAASFFFVFFDGVGVRWVGRCVWGVGWGGQCCFLLLLFWQLEHARSLLAQWQVLVRRATPESRGTVSHHPAVRALRRPRAVIASPGRLTLCEIWQLRFLGQWGSLLESQKKKERKRESKQRLYKPAGPLVQTGRGARHATEEERVGHDVQAVSETRQWHWHKCRSK